MSDYLQALRRLADTRIEAIAPAHGRVLDSPREYLQSLIEHRLGRQQKVIDALTKTAGGTIEELLPVVYDDVPRILHPVAALSLEAHLIKLLNEKQISRVGDPPVWSPVS